MGKTFGTRQSEAAADACEHVEVITFLLYCCKEYSSAGHDYNPELVEQKTLIPSCPSGPPVSDKQCWSHTRGWLLRKWLIEIKAKNRTCFFVCFFWWIWSERNILKRTSFPWNDLLEHERAKWSVSPWCTCAVPSSQNSIVLFYIETLRAEAHKAWFSGAENAISMETDICNLTELHRSCVKGGHSRQGWAMYETEG